MKVLFSSQYTVEFDGKYYYNNGLESTYRRYLILGDELTIIARVKRVEHSTASRIDDSAFKFVFIHKINTLSSMLTKIQENNTILKKEVEKADLCVAHIPATNSNLVVKYAKQMHKPYITVVVGCVWDALWNYDWRGKLLAPRAFLEMRHTQKEAPYSIYVTKQFLQHRYPTNGKWIACSNVNMHTGDETVLMRRIEQIKLLKTKFRRLKIGTSAAIDVPYKGQEYVIRALAELRKQGVEYEYCLLGSGSTRRLQGIAFELGVSDLVQFRGALPHNKVASFYDEIDLYVQPSKQEGLPRSVIEAMSRGCLCLGTNVAGIPELVSGKYLFPKGNYMQIANTLKSITIEDLEQEAKRNFEIAKGYDNRILNEKRCNFLLKFKNESFEIS